MIGQSVKDETGSEAGIAESARILDEMDQLLSEMRATMSVIKQILDEESSEREMRSEDTSCMAYSPGSSVTLGS